MKFVCWAVWKEASMEQVHLHSLALLSSCDCQSYEWKSWILADELTWCIETFPLELFDTSETSGGRKKLIHRKIPNFFLEVFTKVISSFRQLSALKTHLIEGRDLVLPVKRKTFIKFVSFASVFSNIIFINFSQTKWIPTTIGTFNSNTVELSMGENLKMNLRSSCNARMSRDFGNFSCARSKNGEIDFSRNFSGSTKFY